MRPGAAVVAVALMLAVAGCGADDDATTSPGPATTTPEATVPPENNTTPPDETPTQEETSPTPGNGGGAGTSPDPDESSPEPDQPTRPPSDRLTPVPSPSDAPPPVTGEVPEEQMEPVLADVMNRAGVARGAVTVVRAQAVTWRDGSLGCPEPGMMYTQALVDGYWVELEAGGKVYDYRLNDRGSFRLCTNPTLKPPPDLGERS